MIALENQANTLNLKAGRLCLDFANTEDWHASDHPEERLRSYADLVAWAEKEGILSEAEAQQLLGEAALRPADAAAVLEQAITLREAIYRIFSAAAGGHPANAADLNIFNQELATALGCLQIMMISEGFAWNWRGQETALDRMLWPVIHSAAELLTSAELNRVGQCADDRGCGYLFLDLSRNRSRRWCDIKDCGNRAKARRHYERQKQGGAR